MNIERWTDALKEAFSKAFQKAMEESRQVVDIEDILLALLDDSSGIMYRTLIKTNVNIYEFMNRLSYEISLKPTQSSVTEENMRISYDLNQLFIKAQTIMNQYKDEYMSVEHLIIALFDSQSSVIQKIIKQFKLNKKDIEKLADLTSFPVYVGLSKENPVIYTMEEFIAIDANLLFSEEMITSIAGADETTLKPSRAGFTLHGPNGMPSITFGIQNGKLGISGINY